MTAYNRLIDCRGVDARKLKRGTWATVDEENQWIQSAHQMLQKSSFLEHLNLRANASSVGEAKRTTTTTTASSTTPKTSIPKIIHQIWLGSARPATTEYTSWFSSWVERHPDWKIRWWQDQDVQDMIQREEFVNVKAFNAAKNYGEKSDILRYEILFRFGGLYVDTDMECVESFDSLHSNQICSFYAGWSNTGTIELNNGIFGAAPKHPILQSMIDSIHNSCALIPNNTTSESSGINNIAQVNSFLAGFLDGDGAASLVQATKHQPTNKWNVLMETIERTGPGLFTRHVLNHLVKTATQHGDILPVIIAPMAVLYPVPNNVGPVTEDIRRACVIPGTTLAIHHWAKSWQ
jgi:mannosyltransferase OCH1-like enzyme